VGVGWEVGHCKFHTLDPTGSTNSGGEPRYEIGKPDFGGINPSYDSTTEVWKGKSGIAVASPVCHPQDRKQISVSRSGDVSSVTHQKSIGSVETGKWQKSPNRYFH
jgi:hypothetical protein